MLRRAKHTGNGGTIITARSLQIATVIYIVSILLVEVMDPTKGWRLDIPAGMMLISKNIPWFGAIFTVAYAGLYTRFQSQVSWLLEFRDDIMKSNSDCEITQQRKAVWIEQAEDCHLIRKPTFAYTAHAWMNDKNVKAAYYKMVIGGKKRLEQLNPNIRTVIARHRRVYHRTKHDSRAICFSGILTVIRRGPSGRRAESAD